MRLLNTSTLVVEEFFSQNLPEYAILSHTWEKEEVTLQDMISGCATEKKGWAKIIGSCKKALADGFRYCWIDTCCIDKASSAELSEAINSMYKWYEGSCICYVYLSDVSEDSKKLFCHSVGAKSSFDLTRWFKRGWTLQELIAPVVVEFYNVKWQFIGTKRSLQRHITMITGIDIAVLGGASPRSCDIATRMSWASRRQTTRIEDQSYCLLGLFGVNMPLLYGEGQKAFLRLQEEILKIEEDYTLFTWYPASHDRISNEGLLAREPSDFNTLGKDSQIPGVKFPERLYRNPFALFTESDSHLPPYLTSRGLRISLPLMPAKQISRFWACLTLVSLDHEYSHMLCVPLHLIERGADIYERCLDTPPQALPRVLSGKFRRKLVYVTQPKDQAVVKRFVSDRQPKQSSGFLWTPQFLFIQAATNDNIECEFFSSPMLDLRTFTTISAQSFQAKWRTIYNPPASTSELLSKATGRRLSIHSEEHPMLDKIRLLSKEDISDLTMNTGMDACYIIPDNADTYIGFRDSLHSMAFAVRLHTLEDRAWCEVRSITSALFDKMAVDPTEFERSFRGICKERHDHVTIDLTADNFLFSPRVTVSIRRAASALGQFTRYILSVEELSFGP
jgi:hypothetical protein